MITSNELNETIQLIVFFPVYAFILWKFIIAHEIKARKYILNILNIKK